VGLVILGLDLIQVGPDRYLFKEFLFPPSMYTRWINPKKEKKHHFSSLGKTIMGFFPFGMYFKMAVIFKRSWVVKVTPFV
jgi:hypothetical protein